MVAHSGAIRVEGWSGTSALWQLAGLGWGITWLCVLLVALLIDAAVPLHWWFFVVPMMCLLYGYMLIVLPGLLLAPILVVPALRADRLAIMGVGAIIASFAIYQIFWSAVLADV